MICASAPTVHNGGSRQWQYLSLLLFGLSLQGSPPLAHKHTQRLISALSFPLLSLCPPGNSEQISSDGFPHQSSHKRLWPSCVVMHFICLLLLHFPDSQEHGDIRTTLYVHGFQQTEKTFVVHRHKRREPCSLLALSCGMNCFDFRFTLPRGMPKSYRHCLDLVMFSAAWLSHMDNFSVSLGLRKCLLL